MLPDLANLEITNKVEHISIGGHADEGFIMGHRSKQMTGLNGSIFNANQQCKDLEVDTWILNG